MSDAFRRGAPRLCRASRELGRRVIFFVVREDHSFGFQYFLEDRAGSRRDVFRILGADDLMHDRRADPGTYVFAVDDMLPAERALLGSVWDQLRGHEGRVRLLNHPLHTLGRFALLRALHASGRSRVQVVRATEPDGVDFASPCSCEKRRGTAAI